MVKVCNFCSIPMEFLLQWLINHLSFRPTMLVWYQFSKTKGACTVCCGMWCCFKLSGERRHRSPSSDLVMANLRRFYVALLALASTVPRIAVSITNSPQIWFGTTSLVTVGPLKGVWRFTKQLARLWLWWCTVPCTLGPWTCCPCTCAGHRDGHVGERDASP